jgi:hypothetical protein
VRDEWCEECEGCTRWAIVGLRCYGAEVFTNDTMTEWITDRLPTAADADRQGDVRVPYKPCSIPGQGVFAHYSVVVPGQPWWSRNAAARTAQPTPPPAPAPTRVVYAMCAAFDNMYAACNDGTVWARSLMCGWVQVASIPQPEAPNA